MSTILKALQKVEESLQRQGERTAAPDPLWGQAGDAPPAKPRRRLIRIGLWMLLLLGGTGGTGYWLLFGSRGGHREGQSLVRKEAVGDMEPAGPIIVQPVGNARKPALAPAADKPVAGEKPVLAAGLVAAETVPSEHAADPVVEETGAGSHSPAAVRRESALPKAVAVHPRIVVTGIAYQQDRSVRLAIVNDRALGEGEVVQGAVVREILEDRVRFVKNGSSFEVALSR